MAKKAHGQVRRSQVITTYGPGALIDLPNSSGIVGGLDTWPAPKNLEQILEPRLARKLAQMTGVEGASLYAPPPESTSPSQTIQGIDVYRFPRWFVVVDEGPGANKKKSRRLVHRGDLENNKFEGKKVVATRFVRACPKGHISDVNWYAYVHDPEDKACRRQLWLDEQGTSGDLSELIVRCECGKRRSLYEATQIDLIPLGMCHGQRPWLGKDADEDCNHPSRLLIRTASNAYFPQVVSVLSLPQKGAKVATAVGELWSDLQIVDKPEELDFAMKKPAVANALAPFDKAEILEAIQQRKGAGEPERPVKDAELDAILAAPEGFGDDIPIDPDFHARKLPDRVWRRGARWSGVKAVYQLHRLREVLALAGFTRFEAAMPDIHGEYETDVERADIALQPSWFPAVENRGEGVLIQLCSDAVKTWLNRDAVKERLEGLRQGHGRWVDLRKSKRPFPGGPYILLHTLSHLLIQSLAMRCGYSASSIRERIYSDDDGARYGVLLYTASPDAEGTLGGLVQQARHIEDHLAHAMRAASLCSNDPICAQHRPGKSMEERWLHGAACHGCALVAETSCEMRNDYLDRALLTAVLGVPGAAFFMEQS